MTRHPDTTDAHALRLTNAREHPYLVGVVEWDSGEYDTDIIRVSSYTGDVSSARVTPIVVRTVSITRPVPGSDNTEERNGYEFAGPTMGLTPQHARDLSAALLDAAERAETAILPGWDDMTDVDQGCALAYAWKRENEGDAYAAEHYPARYFDHPALAGLGDDAANAHAVRVAGGWDDANDRLGTDEVMRLYELALDREADATA